MNPGEPRTQVSKKHVVWSVHDPDQSSSSTIARFAFSHSHAVRARELVQQHQQKLRNSRKQQQQQHSSKAPALLSSHLQSMVPNLNSGSSSSSHVPSFLPSASSASASSTGAAAAEHSAQVCKLLGAIPCLSQNVSPSPYLDAMRFTFNEKQVSSYLHKRPCSEQLVRFQLQPQLSHPQSPAHKAAGFSLDLSAAGLPGHPSRNSNTRTDSIGAATAAGPGMQHAGAPHGRPATVGGTGAFMQAHASAGPEAMNVDTSSQQGATRVRTAVSSVGGGVGECMCLFHPIVPFVLVVCTLPQGRKQCVRIQYRA